MGAGHTILQKKNRPDLKGHRQWLVSHVKPRVRGLPVKWALTQKHFEGCKFNPWGVLEHLHLGVSTEWLNGRKVKLSLGSLAAGVVSDALLTCDFGGNRELSGAINVLAECTFITYIDLHSTHAHGDLSGKPFIRSIMDILLLLSRLSPQ